MSRAKPLVLVSWNGRDPALSHLHVDAPAQFDWLIFDYSGQGRAPDLPEGVQAAVIHQATQCKGEIYRALATWLDAQPIKPPHVALIDDDVLMGVSDINRLLHVAALAKLHVFSPALTHDSHRSHRWMLRRGDRLLREVDWVEVMMPFYSFELFMALAPHLGNNVSSWGIDRYLTPTVQKVKGLEGCAIVDAVVASHRRPVTSGQTTFANGLTAMQESERLKKVSMDLIQAHRADLVGSDWYRRIFVQRHTQSRWMMMLEGLGRPLKRWMDRST